MDEQRYVVEITRRVPPEKVEQVAQRIAERLNVPRARIVTLLEGRVGDVTKPVLADKADAIAEVFAAAGVRVVVAAARTHPPQYEERFGEPLERAEAERHEPSTGSEERDPSYPEPDYQEYGHVSYGEADHYDVAHDAADEDPGYEEADSDEPPDWHAYQPGAQEASAPEEKAQDEVPWGQDATWGFDSAAAREWAPAPEQHEPPPEPVEPPFEPQPHVPEEEADRLGPSSHTLRVEYDTSPPPGGYAASTRWTPSPHDPYAFAPEDAPGYDGRRATPIGPARTEPLSAPYPGSGHPARAVSADREGVGGFFSPDESELREGPRLRVYLLWALAISLLVLVLLQFVLALRADGADVAVVGAYEAGLVAYRKGDFVAARGLWEPVAEAGNPQAQYFLGFMLQNGLGQPWSNARAANWYRRAANQGLPEAQLALGELYLSGMGVELDPRVGAAWYASAAVTGDATGQFEYARLLLHGVGVEQDMAAALAWFEAAALQGHEAAADYVAYAHANAGALAADSSLP